MSPALDLAWMPKRRRSFNLSAAALYKWQPHVGIWILNIFLIWWHASPNLARSQTEVTDAAMWAADDNVIMAVVSE